MRSVDPQAQNQCLPQRTVPSVNVPLEAVTDSLPPTAGIGPPTTSLCHRPLSLDSFRQTFSSRRSFFFQPHFLSGPATSRATKKAPNTTHTISGENVTQRTSSAEGSKDKAAGACVEYKWPAEAQSFRQVPTGILSLGSRRTAVVCGQRESDLETSFGLQENTMTTMLQSGPKASSCLFSAN